jgi:signal peptidase I
MADAAASASLSRHLPFLEKRRGRRSVGRQIARGIAIGAGVAILFAALTRSGYAVSIDRVDTGSMLPTLACAANGSDPTCEGSISARFLVDHFTYHFRGPRDGEIVTFTLPPPVAALLTTRCGIPGDRGEYVKRVIATGGETLAFADGRIWRDGRRLTEPYLLGRHDAITQMLVALAHSGNARMRRHARLQLTALQMTWLDNEGRRVVTVHVPRGSVYLMGDNRSASCDSRAFGPVPLTDVRGRVVQSSIAPLTQLSSLLATLHP